MALNKDYWNYASANSEDWLSNGLKYANTAIYGNPNFTYGSLDLSFPTSFRRSNITKIICSGMSNFSAESVSDCLIYNSMIQYRGNVDTGAFYKDNIMTQMPQYGEGYNPVIDIDTHDFAFKMNLQLFSGGNWISVNAVDFVNNYASYAANVYGYIDNALMTDSNYYTFCNYYDTGDSIFSVKANNHGYRTTGYGSTNLGGHACSGTTTWSDKSIYQIATTSGWRRYNTNPGNFNMFIPYEIPEADGTSWTGNGGNTPACLNTAGIYTNHALLRYTDQRVFMPLKHILRDIIVNCGLVLLDSTDTKWISMVDGNGLCQGKLVLLSSDEAKESSIYNTRTSDNNLNPSPAPSGDDEDNDDPLSSVGAPFGTGLAHYYISTVDGAALTQISEAMSTWDIDATKKDLYRNLISCKIVKPPTAVPATTGVFEIYGVKPQYNGADITINEVTGNADISFGPYTINRKFGDFRDRAPYSKAEIFLPYCGWCALPSHVIGRSVSVAYYSDIIAGTVKAVVFCGTNPVAEASGIMSVDIPFAAQNVGEKVAAANIGMLAYGRAAIQTAAGIGTAVASKGKSGWGNILSGGTAVTSAYNQLAQVENGNYTEICGKSGDGCALAGVDTIVIKITRPLYGGNSTAPYVPAGFAHTVGFVSMKQSKVNACTGLIVCDNVEVSGISGATDAERAEIKRVLETGLYVNSPPE